MQISFEDWINVWLNEFTFYKLEQAKYLELSDKY